MILLRPDYLIFELGDGELLPLPAEMVTIEMIDSTDCVDQEMIRNITAAILHYFRVELGKQSVSLSEFAQELEKAIAHCSDQPKPSRQRRIREADINDLFGESEERMELDVYRRLRQEMRELLDGQPDELRFSGLRHCVKQVLRAKRWGRRCQNLNDQIVAYLHDCLRAHASSNCSLVVRS